MPNPISPELGPEEQFWAHLRQGRLMIRRWSRALSGFSSVRDGCTVLRMG
jgi:hypothetical protein